MQNMREKVKKQVDQFERSRVLKFALRAFKWQTKASDQEFNAINKTDLNGRSNWLADQSRVENENVNRMRQDHRMQIGRDVMASSTANRGIWLRHSRHAKYDLGTHIGNAHWEHTIDRLQ